MLESQVRATDSHVNGEEETGMQKRLQWLNHR